MSESSSDVKSEAQSFPQWRRWTAGALIVISCVLVPVSVLAIWLRGQVLNTDRYVENITPLASNQNVIDTAATQLTNTLFDNVDVKQLAEDALPPRADFLAAPLAAGVKDAVERAAVAILSTDQFKKVWIEANRVAHDQIVKALTDQGRVIKTPNGKIVLDLSALIGQVRTALDERGITVFDKLRIQKLSLKFELMDSDQLAKAQTGAKLLKGLSWVAPILALLALAGGLALSPNRRRSLLRWGIGAAVAAGVIGASVTIGRSFYLDAVVSPDLTRETAAAVFDTLVRFLRQGVRLMIAIGLVTALAAWVSGPSGAAVKVRADREIADGERGRRREHARLELRSVRLLGVDPPGPAADRVGIGGAPRARVVGSPPGTHRVRPRDRAAPPARAHRDRGPGRRGRRRTHTRARTTRPDLRISHNPAIHPQSPRVG